MINLELDPPGAIDVTSRRSRRKNSLRKEKESEDKKESADATAAPFDWNILFTAAGLDPSKLQPRRPLGLRWPVADTRMAWTGTWPGTTRPLRVEAAAFQGKPVFFSLIGDWTKPERMKSAEEEIHRRAGKQYCSTGRAVCIAGICFSCAQNYRQDEATGQGHFAWPEVMFLLEMGLWLCRCHFAAIVDTLGLFIIAVSTALFTSGLTWMLYLAVEPWVRRHWRRPSISWSRLLSGQGPRSAGGPGYSLRCGPGSGSGF